jgi:hypothetical protein
MGVGWLLQMLEYGHVYDGECVICVCACAPQPETLPDTMLGLSCAPPPLPDHEIISSPCNHNLPRAP